MFEVFIQNIETDEFIKETVQSEKEIDELVESMHHIFGEVLFIEINKNENLIQTVPYWEKPICPKSVEYHEHNLFDDKTRVF